MQSWACRFFRIPWFHSIVSSIVSFSACLTMCPKYSLLTFVFWTSRQVLCFCLTGGNTRVLWVFFHSNLLSTLRMYCSASERLIPLLRTRQRWSQNFATTECRCEAINDYAQFLSTDSLYEHLLCCHAFVRPSVLLSVTFVHCVKTPTRPIGLQQHTQSCAHDQIICFQHPWFIIRCWRFADSFQFRPIVDASQTIVVEIDWENRSFEVIRGLARSWFLGKRQTVEAVELL